MFIVIIGTLRTTMSKRSFTVAYQRKLSSLLPAQLYWTSESSKNSSRRCCLFTESARIVFTCLKADIHFIAQHHLATLEIYTGASPQPGTFLRMTLSLRNSHVQDITLQLVALRYQTATTKDSRMLGPEDNQDMDVDVDVVAGVDMLIRGKQMSLLSPIPGLVLVAGSRVASLYYISVSLPVLGILYV